jgi:hypothetical protein
LFHPDDKKNAFLAAMPIPLYKVIFGENDSFTEVPCKYLNPQWNLQLLKFVIVIYVVGTAGWISAL